MCNEQDNLLLVKKEMESLDNKISIGILDKADILEYQVQQSAKGYIFSHPWTEQYPLNNPLKKKCIKYTNKNILKLFPSTTQAKIFKAKKMTTSFLHL